MAALRTAAHEAGHLVIAIAMGYESAHATLEPPVTVVPDESDDHAALIAAGGVAGVTVAGIPHAWDGQEFDVAHAEKALKRRVSFDDWEDLVDRAVTLLSSEPHRTMHEVATRMLVEFGEVSARDCLKAV